LGNPVITTAWAWFTVIAIIVTLILLYGKLLRKRPFTSHLVLGILLLLLSVDPIVRSIGFFRNHSIFNLCLYGLFAVFFFVMGIRFIRIAMQIRKQQKAEKSIQFVQP